MSLGVYELNLRLKLWGAGIQGGIANVMPGRGLDVVIGLEFKFFCFFKGPFSTAPAKASFEASSLPSTTQTTSEFRFGI